MNKTLSFASMAMLPLLGYADDFDYEVSLGYEQTDTETSIRITFPGIEPTTNQFDTEQRELSLGGTWFIEGLSDANGPRSQAAFVDRASSVSLRFTDSTLETDAFSTNGPTVDDTFKVDINDISLGGRYVWKNSGWFVSGQYLDGDVGDINGDISVSALSAGVGKYIGATTSLELSLARQNVDNGFDDDDDTGIALAFNHLGNLTDQWQYGVTVSASSASLAGANGSYNAGFSLYPNRDVSLRVNVTGEIGGGGNDTNMFDVGAGWFFTPQLEGRLTFGFVDEGDDGVDSTFFATDTDSSNVSASVRYRF